MLNAFADLSTPLVADACVRSDVPLRAAPPGIGASSPGTGSRDARCRRGTTAAWTCSWRRSYCVTCTLTCGISCC